MSNPPVKQPQQGPSKKGGKKMKNEKVSVNINMPTIQERTAQIAASIAAPIEPLPRTPVPKEELSAWMDSAFPCEIEPVKEIVDITIDPNGFSELCKNLYRQTVQYEPRYQESLSEAEFLLANGYLLAHRVLHVRSKSFPFYLDGWVELDAAMRAVDEIPAPISQFLENVGLYRDAMGVTVRPDLVLPRGDVHNHTSGMLPSVINDNYAGNTRWTLNSSMFQYGMLERRIVDDGTNGAAPAVANFYVQLDPANAVVADDAHLVTATAALPEAIDTLRAHPRRVPQMPQAFFDRNQPILLNSIRWSSSIMGDYLNFLSKVKKNLVMAKYNRSSAGSPSQTVTAVPKNGTTAIRCTEYDYYAFSALSKNEMHIARLFKYRVDRSLQPHCSEPGTADAHISYRRAPAHMSGDPPCQLSRLREYYTYLGFYIRHYIN